MDRISSLPDAIIAHILSFLPTKKAASTSILSKRWRLLFAEVLNVDLDDSDYVLTREEDDYDEKWNKDPTSFMDFVDRILALQENAKVHRFSLHCRDGVDQERVHTWIETVLQRRLSHLVLDVNMMHFELPSNIFVSERLVKLNIEQEFRGKIEVVSLPRLKTFYLRGTSYSTTFDELVKLFSCCPVLEELVLKLLLWCHAQPRLISITTLKRLTLECRDMDENPSSVTFDTPNLCYLDYTDRIAKDYPIVNLRSLVKAVIDITLSPEQRRYASDEVKKKVGNATNFFMGLCSVEKLFLTARSLEVLTFCCEETPVFNNLVHLTIENDKEVVWKALPGLLENCPNLETLVFKGLFHKRSDGCGNMCRCEPMKKSHNPSCLLSSPVKVLKIYLYEDRMETGQIKLFLEKMPCLERLIVYLDDVYQYTSYPRRGFKRFRK